MPTKKVVVKKPNKRVEQIIRIAESEGKADAILIKRLPKKRLLELENVKIFSKNFSGKQGMYNPEGLRNFCVILDDDELAHELREEGWNIKWFKPDPEHPNEPTKAFMQVKVSYLKKPPKILMMSGNGQSMLDEDDVKILDWADIDTSDIIINPSPWSVQGKSGIKAYLKAMYVTVQEDKFEAKYRNAVPIPDEDLEEEGDDDD